MAGRSCATSCSRANLLAACKERSVTANCLHPGFVATRFGDQSGALMSRIVWLAKFFAISPAKGAETIVYLASSPDVAKTTGQYFYESVPAIAVVVGPGRPICSIALAAQRGIGRHEGIVVLDIADYLLLSTAR